MSDIDCSTWASRMAKRAGWIITLGRGTLMAVDTLFTLAVIVALIVLAIREMGSWL